MTPASLTRGEVAAAAAVLVVLAVWVAARLVAREAAPPPALDVRQHVVDLNLATHDELTVLPGVGPATAARIVEGRPYASTSELRRVVGERVFELVEAYVSVAPVGSGPASPTPGGGSSTSGR